MSDKHFYKNNPTDKIWWVYDRDRIGALEFSFDQKTIFNTWSDYPTKLTKEQKELFDKENPNWARFFADRS